VFADVSMHCLRRVFSHVLQVEIFWTPNPLRIGEGFGEIRLGEAKELVFVNLLSFAFWHLLALQASNPQCSSPRLVLKLADIIPCRFAASVSALPVL
jgi:hypothetical protein